VYDEERKEDSKTERRFTFYFILLKGANAHKMSKAVLGVQTQCDGAA
jgi:hypothetical protein